MTSGGFAVLAASLVAFVIVVVGLAVVLIAGRESTERKER